MMGTKSVLWEVGSSLVGELRSKKSQKKSQKKNQKKSQPSRQSKANSQAIGISQTQALSRPLSRSGGKVGDGDDKVKDNSPDKRADHQDNMGQQHEVRDSSHQPPDREFGDGFDNFKDNQSAKREEHQSDKEPQHEIRDKNPKPPEREFGDGFEVQSGKQHSEAKRAEFNEQFGKDFVSTMGNVGLEHYRNKEKGEDGERSNVEKHQQSESKLSFEAEHTHDKEGNTTSSHEMKHQDKFGNKSSMSSEFDSKKGTASTTFQQKNKEGTVSSAFDVSKDKHGGSSMNFSTKNEDKGSSMDFGMESGGGLTTINLKLNGGISDIFSGMKEAKNMYKTASKAKSALPTPKKDKGKSLLGGKSTPKALPSPKKEK
jgi:hypothetical protein